jgi:Na+/H+-dicarboxylate symporter
MRSAVVILIAAFGVILWGGYTLGWEWTGVSDKDTLWHWMQILMVPIAFAALPGVLRDHQAMHIGRKFMIFGLVVLFVGFVIVSYVVPWNWTGFTGNTLWDWLSLLLLPIAITSVRFLRSERTLTWAHYASAAVLLAGFGVLVVFGYVAPWDWTGFTGNTFLDWVQLLILPILFPTVVPAAAAWLTAKRED